MQEEKIEPIQNVVFKFTCYKMGTLLLKIEPIQNVVFKLSFVIT